MNQVTMYKLVIEKISKSQVKEKSFDLLTIIAQDNPSAFLSAYNKRFPEKKLYTYGDYTITEDQINEILRIRVSNKMVGTIKAIRDVTGWGLKESKGFYDKYYDILKIEG